MILNPRMVGSGETTLVLSHGYGGSQAIWDKMLPHLSRRNKVFLFDWDFTGSIAADEAEEGEHGRYTFSRFADELVALMDEMKLRNVVYIGHSMAGMVGCIASIKRPELFSQLVLIGASPRYMNSADYEGGFEASDIEAMLDRISSDFRGWAEGFVPLAVGSADPWAVERLARSFFAMDPRVAYALARMIFLDDQRHVLGHVTVPCTLVHVSRDFAAPPCVGWYMQARMQAARCAAVAMKTIDSVGHFPQLVAPDALLEILNLVLGSHRNGEKVGPADAEVNSGDIGMAPQSKLLV
ncbi:hypothetical protein PR202_ga10622 [Eleusine coracana subsp. coracana]|uniref:AB hydrolase-1 domain-containing protein n=1 Tax=Eleusine coracana subsp. coracana TaxID=191504 RepID=A0AAV5C756_ELECO|nr:hypothetical protein PR202_ga10622 [Eleusine coracana subsp. coracana]